MKYSDHEFSALYVYSPEHCASQMHVIFPRALDVLKHKEGAVDEYTLPT